MIVNIKLSLLFGSYIAVDRNILTVTWEKLPSGDDPPAPYPTWDFFELGNFLKWNDPPP